MNKLITTLYEAMTEGLQEVALTAENLLQRAERCYHVVEQAIEQLKGFIVSYTFKDQQEEITFFKEIKPMFLRELMYYMEIFYVESWKPAGKEPEYYRQVSERINAYFERNHSLYIYYKLGSDKDDEMYFVRNAGNQFILPEYSLDIDPRFSTVHSFKLSKIQAYERFNDYLHQSIYQLEHTGSPDIANERIQPQCLWTDAKSDLIELGYGIHARRSINHGKADIKLIMTVLQTAFNVNLGNYYRTFQNLRIRKKNRTPYWDGAKDDLIKTMDNSDLNYL